MKIKLAILEKDLNYLRRVVSAFETKYADKVEIYSFSDREKAINRVNEERIDVFLASETFEVERSEVPKRTGLAYLVEANGVDFQNGYKAISKYQKADMMYKQILSIYAECSEMSSDGFGISSGEGTTRMVAFTSPCGGVGTSSIAAAYAMRLAKMGKKALYLNLEKIGATDSVFEAAGQGNFSEIIYSLKKRTNLPVKLESCVRMDHRGVYYFPQATEALDMMELNREEMDSLLHELAMSDSFDCVIVDMDFVLDKSFVNTLGKMHRVVLTTDGSSIANMKITRAVRSIELIEKNSDVSLSKKLGLIYNKYSNKVGKAVDTVELVRIGGSPRFEHATSGQVVEELSKLAMLDNI